MAHGDYTGTTKAQLARAAAEEQQFAAQRMSMVTDAVRTAQQGTVSLYTDDDWATGESLKNGIVEDGVENFDPVQRDEWSPVKFRASEDLDDVTVGQNRHFTLKAGQVYKAPKWVARHLDTQALVHH